MPAQSSMTLSPSAFRGTRATKALQWGSLDRELVAVPFAPTSGPVNDAKTEAASEQGE
jgi:hypothetical protein